MVSYRSLVWAATLTWSLILNLYVAVYDTILGFLAALLTAAALDRPTERVGARFPLAFRVLMLLLYLAPWITQPVARLTGFQLFTVVLMAVGGCSPFEQPSVASGLLGGLVAQVLPISVHEVLGGFRRHQVVNLIPIHESDQEALVVVPRLLLDPDQTHLVQIDDGEEVAICLVPSQFEKSRHREPPLLRTVDVLTLNAAKGSDALSAPA
jgi:hypothetical protein